MEWAKRTSAKKRRRTSRKPAPTKDTAVSYILDNKDSLNPQCRICNVFLTSIEDLKAHQRDQHQEYTFFCKLCGKGFKTWNGHAGHMERHKRGEM